MRNIVQIDFNDTNNCGVLNSASSESSILLCITPEARQKTSLKVEITGSNGEVLTSPELTAAGGIIRYEADREYWTEAGTMKVRLLSGEGNSQYANFYINELVSGEDDVKVKNAGEAGQYTIETIKRKDGTIRFSTDEIETGEVWIDGEKIYRKTVHVGKVVSGKQSVANHGISNIKEIWIDLSNSFLKAENGNTYVIPRVSYLGLNQSVEAIATKTQIILNPGSDANFDDCYVTIRYTKSE